MKNIRSAVVIGAGVMGSAIAGYLAGAGIPCHLLDIVPEGATDRNILANTALKKLPKTKPPYLFSKEDLSRITPGNLEDHLDCLQDVDWIIEAVVERLDIKRNLFEKIEKIRKEDSIVSSNTSGISLEKMCEGFSESFQKHFLITHFFNPVRYMRLLEIVGGKNTDPKVIQRFVHFGEYTLGKGIVYGKDTPNFIANRIGIYEKMLTIHEMVKGDYTVEEVDKVFGTLLGRPKSAACRTADIVGLDTTANVVNYLREVLDDPKEKELFTLPDFYMKMLENGWLGQKSKGGFYKVEKTKEGKNILSLDLKTLEYSPQKKIDSSSIKVAKGITNLEGRLRKFILEEDDRLAKLARKVTFQTLLYAVSLIPTISDDIINIDNALKWGYNWEIGLFETWDALGVKESVQKMEAEGYTLPENLKKFLEDGNKRFYKEENGKKLYFDFGKSSYLELKEKNYKISLPKLHEKNKVVYHNPGASLLDMGDGVLGLEIHTDPVNVVDDDVITAMNKAVSIGEQDFRGILIANQGSHFCLGANLMMVMMAIQGKDWDSIRKVTQTFQKANQKMKYCQVPVVVAPFGMSLGGGCEIALGANHIHASMELYTGLVEVGVGLIPAGGGCLNMLKRYLGNIPVGIDLDKMTLVRHLFETVGMAKVSISAKNARELKFLSPSDTITLNPDRLIFEAKQMVITLADSGYQPEEPWKDFTLPGENGISGFTYILRSWKDAGVITPYDTVVAEKLATILCGGMASSKTAMSEDYILELEVENFLSLCGEEGTLARIKHMLMTKKPLRN